MCLAWVALIGCVCLSVRVCVWLFVLIVWLFVSVGVWLCLRLFCVLTVTLYATLCMLCHV